MDRQIEESVLRDKRRHRIAVTLGLGIIFILGVTLIIGWVRPSIKRSVTSTARVTRGPVEATIEASGTVVPAFENVLSSPIDARVIRVLRRPGAIVHRGDEIVQLDLSASQLVLERLDQQLAQKRNEQEKERSRVMSDIATLQHRSEQKQLDLDMARYRAAQNGKLRREGLVSEETAREADVAEKKAEIEIKQLEGEMDQSRRTLAASEQAAALDRHLLERERQEAANQLEVATTRADRDGVLTWVTPQEGATIRRGDILARVADLGTVRILGSVSDVHASEIKPGMPVHVRAEERRIAGHVVNVEPTVTEGTVRFYVDLDEAPGPLHNQQRVDVFVVTNRRATALKVARGAFADSGIVFVVRDDRAERVRTRFGLLGFDDVEVVEGLKEGDEVITSDMKDYEHLQEVRIR